MDSFYPFRTQEARVQGMSCRIPRINWSRGNADTLHLPASLPIPNVTALGQHSADLGCCLLVTPVFIPRGYESLIILAAFSVHLQLAVDMQVLRYVTRAPCPPVQHLFLSVSGPAVAPHGSQRQPFICMANARSNRKEKSCALIPGVDVSARDWMALWFGPVLMKRIWWESLVELIYPTRG